MSEAAIPTISLPASRDALTEVLRHGARTLLAQAVEAEVAAWIDEHADVTDAAGRRQVVRHGYSPERRVVTALGPLPVNQPRVHDRRPAGEREKFTSSILPPYLRKTKSVEELIPFLYFRRRPAAAVDHVPVRELVILDDLDFLAVSPKPIEKLVSGRRAARHGRTPLRPSISGSEKF